MRVCHPHPGVQSEPIRNVRPWRTILTARGHTLVPFDADPADVYIVNSCTVTATSDKKSRQAVRQARKRAHPEALVALCGCYPQVSPEDAAGRSTRTSSAGSGDRLGFSGPLGANGRAGNARKPNRWENLDDALPPHGSSRPCPRGGAGGPHPRHAESGGRLRQFLHLLHHPLRPRGRALSPRRPGSGAGQGPGRGRGIGSWSSPALSFLPTAGTCPAGRTWPASSRPCAMPCRRCGSASAPWSRAR